MCWCCVVLCCVALCCVVLCWCVGFMLCAGVVVCWNGGVFNWCATLNEGVKRQNLCVTSSVEVRGPLYLKLK